MYLTIGIITNPVLANNNRGENEGNLQTLQKVTTREGSKVILTGNSIRYAARDSMQAAGAHLWREILDEPEEKNNAGYGYATKSGKRVPAMADAIPDSATDYDDTILFGYMVAKKGNNNEATKQRGNVEVSNAISTTPYSGGTSFRQGLKASASPNGTVDLAPYSQEDHFTRFQYTVTANLGTISKRPGALPYFLRSLLSLRVGGSHAANANEVTPAVVFWRFHKAPGRGGLYLGAGLDIRTNVPVDLAPLAAHCKNLGITDYQVAGVGQAKSVAEAIEEMITRANEEMARFVSKS